MFDKIKQAGAAFAIAGTLIGTMSVTLVAVKLLVLDPKNEKIAEIQLRASALEETSQLLKSQNEELVLRIDRLQAEVIRINSSPSPRQHAGGSQPAPAQPLKQESRGRNSPNIFQGDNGKIDFQVNEGGAASRPPYEEPTQEEMKAALLSSMVGRGGVLKGSDTVVAEVLISGTALQIVEFDKLGCNPAAYGAGYACSYRSVLRVTYYSTEGTAAGDNHARAVNTLMGWFNRGNTSTATSTRRFAKLGSDWIASEE